MSASNNNIYCPIAASFLMVERHNRLKAKAALNERYSARYEKLSIDALDDLLLHQTACLFCAVKEVAA